MRGGGQALVRYNEMSIMAGNTTEFVYAREHSDTAYRRALVLIQGLLDATHALECMNDTESRFTHTQGLCVAQNPRTSRSAVST